MPYNFLLRYDCELFCAIHIKKHNTSCQKRMMRKKTSNTYYIRTRILVSTFLSYCSQKLTYVFRFRNCILTLLCINGYVVLIYLYNAECLVRFLEGFKERFQKCFRRVRTDGNRGKRYVVVPIFIFARK